MNLLKAQILKEEKDLEQDKDELRVLQEGVKSTEALRRKRANSLHPLAKLCAGTSNRPRLSCSSTHTTHRPFSQILEEDEDLGPLLVQLRSHFDSIVNNTATMQQVSNTIDATRTTLDMSALHVFGPVQYGKLYELNLP